VAGCGGSTCYSPSLLTLPLCSTRPLHHRLFSQLCSCFLCWLKQLSSVTYLFLLFTLATHDCLPFLCSRGVSLAPSEPFALGCCDLFLLLAATRKSPLNIQTTLLSTHSIRDLLWLYLLLHPTIFSAPSISLFDNCTSFVPAVSCPRPARNLSSRGCSHLRDRLM
jgi:hypothetical protein